MALSRHTSAMVGHRALVCLLIVGGLLLGAVIHVARHDGGNSRGSELVVGQDMPGRQGECDRRGSAMDAKCQAACAGAAVALPALPRRDGKAGLIPVRGTNRFGREPAPDPRPPNGTSII
jgi:hypothetical protein